MGWILWRDLKDCIFISSSLFLKHLVVKWAKTRPCAAAQSKALYGLKSLVFTEEKLCCCDEEGACWFFRISLRRRTAWSTLWSSAVTWTSTFASRYPIVIFCRSRSFAPEPGQSQMANSWTKHFSSDMVQNLSRLKHPCSNGNPPTMDVHRFFKSYQFALLSCLT